MPDGMFRATNVGGTGVPVLILSYTWLTLVLDRESRFENHDMRGEL